MHQLPAEQQKLELKKGTEKDLTHCGSVKELGGAVVVVQRPPLCCSGPMPVARSIAHLEVVRCHPLWR